MKQPRYVLDTSVLYLYLRGKAGFGDGAVAPRYCKAFDRLLAGSHVIIPHIVLVEMMGQFFHTNIDLDDYEQWRRRRKVAFNPILSAVFQKSNVHVRQERPRMAAINRAHEIIPEKTVTKLSRRFSGGTLRPREPKYLDGADAQILDDAICTAMEDRTTKCYLVTSDTLLKVAVEQVTDESSRSARLPDNLEALGTYSLPARMGVPPAPGSQNRGKPAGSRRRHGRGHGGDQGTRDENGGKMPPRGGSA